MVTGHKGDQSVPAHPAAVDLNGVEAIVFDTDGVITDTARTHAQAWKRAFDAFLRERAARTGDQFQSFDVARDYLSFVDGKQRLDGAIGFLESRGIPVKGQVVAVRELCDRKDEYFLSMVRRDGAAAFPDAIAFIRQVRRRGARTAAVSASRNCEEVLRAAGVADMFDIRVDGREAARLGLPGKPHPALFLEASTRLGTTPAKTAVVEDSLAGVEAGRRGRFGLVVGVDHGSRGTDLCAHGADVVVTDLRDLRIVGRRQVAEIRRSP
ncbi:MAG: HAD-IA family hydrolase [Streptosporangiales bacterium]|nr:HAD-IA family hydrolase [Streptosporangiales bacterium]